MLIVKPYLALWVLLVCVLVGCASSLSEYPIPPARGGLAHSVSADTIDLDTLPSDMLSSTHSLRLFNPSQSPLVLSRVYLASGGSRGIQLNIDGRATTEVRDVVLSSRDSLFVFVRAHLPEGASDAPELIQDSLVVVESSGRTGVVLLRAVRQNVRYVDHLHVSGAMRLDDRRPLLVRDSVTVAPGGELALSAGTRLWLSADAYVRVDGALLVEGTAERPVLLTSIRRDRFLPRVPYTRVPGQWGGVIVGAEGRVHAEHLQITNAKWGVYHEDAPSWNSRTDYKGYYSHCRLHNLSGIGLRAERGRFLIADSELSNTLGSTVSFAGGVYDVERSSIVNLYAWPGIRSASALSYTNGVQEASAKTLVADSRLSVIHSVLDGGRTLSSGGELSLSILEGASSLPVVRLRDSYIRAKLPAESSAVQTEGLLFPTEPPAVAPSKIYRLVGEDTEGRKDYLYDLRPRPEAPFVGKVATPLPSGVTDLSGRPRPTPASYGAYEP